MRKINISKKFISSLQCHNIFISPVPMKQRLHTFNFIHIKILTIDWHFAHCFYRQMEKQNVFSIPLFIRIQLKQI